ncbi:MAG: TIGR00730 family Rossman fold protein [Chthoniobacteraceae bacterium]
MQDFTGGGIHALPNQLRKSTGDAEIDAKIHQLVSDFGCANSCELIEQLVMTCLKMARDQISIADLKLFNRSLNEMRYAARVFAPYRGHRKVCVFGSARTSPTAPEFLAAEEFSRKMVDHEYMIITGGGDGIMGAAQRGAGAADSFGLNIRLPFEQRANDTIHGDPKLINFNYFFTRKLNFVKETHAIALFPGGFGTMDEGFEALTLMQTGKARLIPFVLVDKPGGTYWATWLRFLKEHLLALGLISEADFNLFHVAPTVDAAVAEIVNYYRVFHSYRWVRQRMVVRLAKCPTASAVEKLNEEFSDIVEEGAITLTAALREESNEPDLAELPRLVLTPHRRNFGRLRTFIDAINASETE